MRLGPSAPSDPKQVDVEFAVLNGPIRATVNLRGSRPASIDATTVNGSVRLHIKRQGPVALDVSSANGAAHLWLPPAFDGILTAATGNGSVALSEELQKYAVIVPGEKGSVWHVRVPEDLPPRDDTTKSLGVEGGPEVGSSRNTGTGPVTGGSEKSDASGADSRVEVRRESGSSEGGRKPGPDRAKAETANGKVRVYLAGEREEASAWSWEGCEVM